MHLALITGAYAKKIVRYNGYNNPDVSGSRKALKMAHSNRKTTNYPLHHSD